LRRVGGKLGDLRDVDYELLMRRKLLEASLGLVDAREKEVGIRIGVFRRQTDVTPRQFREMLMQAWNTMLPQFCGGHQFVASGTTEDLGASRTGVRCLAAGNVGSRRCEQDLLRTVCCDGSGVLCHGGSMGICTGRFLCSRQESKPRRSLCKTKRLRSRDFSHRSFGRLKRHYRSKY